MTVAISTIPKTSKFFSDNLDMNQLNSFLAIKRKKKDVILENTLWMRMLLYILGNWAQFHLFQILWLTFLFSIDFS